MTSGVHTTAPAIDLPSPTSHPTKPVPIPTSSSSTSRFNPSPSAFPSPPPPPSKSLPTAVSATVMFMPINAPTVPNSRVPSQTSAKPPLTATLTVATPIAASPVNSDNNRSPPHTPSPQPSTFRPSTSRTPFKPSAPLPIPVASNSSPPPPITPSQTSIPPPTPTTHLLLPPSRSLPDVIPNLAPSYPATLFGGLSPDDEHVTVWEPATGKTVAGNAAPYRRNLTVWLQAHPGWEEKADELKSSKRRSAARRSRIAAQAFAAICCYPVASFLAADAAQRLAVIGQPKPTVDAERVQWTMEDFVRLQECLTRLAQQVHKVSCNAQALDSRRWTNITRELGESKDESTTVSCAHHMLTRGIVKGIRDVSIIRQSLSLEFGSVVERASSPVPLIGSPTSPSLVDNAGSATLTDIASSAPVPLMGAAAVLELSFRAPREPRVTVWNPSNGRTISGNAAPCRRNLEAWMRLHPGWLPKEEGQLSSSRRNRNRKVRPASAPISSKPAPVASLAEPESPHFHDAIEGLLVLARSPLAHAASLKTMQRFNRGDVDMADRTAFCSQRNRASDMTGCTGQDGKQDESDIDVEDEVTNMNGSTNALMQNGNFALTSSVSCSSLEDHASMSDDDVAESDGGSASDMEM